MGVAQKAEIAGARPVHGRGRGADLRVDVVGDVEGRAVGEEPGEVRGLPVRERHAAVGGGDLVGLGQHVVPAADHRDVAPARDRRSPAAECTSSAPLVSTTTRSRQAGEVAGVERVGEVGVAGGDHLGELAAAEVRRGRGGVLLGIDHRHRPGPAPGRRPARAAAPAGGRPRRRCRRPSRAPRAGGAAYGGGAPRGRSARRRAPRSPRGRARLPPPSTRPPSAPRPPGRGAGARSSRCPRRRGRAAAPRGRAGLGLGDDRRPPGSP